jgi:ribA/ribD-fused uncharacterized protein
MPDEIKFYLKSETNGWLSNFAPWPILLDGRIWPTVEHYYQAGKFPHDSTYQEAIRTCRTPAKAWHLGNCKDRKPCQEWDDVREAVMVGALRAKFTQHAELRNMLIATGDAHIVEASQRDRYWGSGPDGTGRNRLGQLLMCVRQELINLPEGSS